MKEFIIENLLAGSTVSFFDVAIKLFMALAIGATIYIAYYFTSSKVSYNSSFNLSLVAMAIITTAIMAVITNNIALSLGMVGALSIIRFRTAIKDPRDAMFIFWSIMVGICCGVAQYVIAIASTVVLFLFFMHNSLYPECRAGTNRLSGGQRSCRFRHLSRIILSANDWKATICGERSEYQVDQIGYYHRKAPHR